ncbi:FadR/GntR family transcriptional regulator [Enterococcus sp. LJL128]
MNSRGLVNQTITALINYIEENQLTAGQKLPKETDLAKELEIGRSTLREAVKILSFSNVLDVRQGAGTFINNEPFSQSPSVEQLLTAREMLEKQAVEQLAKQECDVAELIQLKEALFERNRLLQEGQFSDYITSDLNFHMKIVSLSKNPFLIKWYNELLPDLKLFLSSQMLKLKDYQDNTILHNELYEAIVDGNYDKAALLISKNNHL